MRCLGDKDVERLDDKKEARAEDGRRLKFRSARSPYILLKCMFTSIYSSFLALLILVSFSFHHWLSTCFCLLNIVISV